MQDSGVAKQIARWVALGALFLVPFTPLIVVSTFFFPFITGKAFYFRILAEIVVAAWIVLALLDARYRPRFSWIGVSVATFVLWMLIADSFAINAQKAFWSNAERMEGWVLLIHLLGFFFASSAVLRVDKKWRAWFLISLGVSVIIAVYALFQIAGAADIHQGSSRIDATLGNSAYLAIYLLFSTFTALWLALTEKQAWLKWSLIVLAVIEGVLIFFTETRGTVLGLVGALSLAALLTAFTAGKEVRRRATFALLIIVLLAGGFYLARNSQLVQGSHVLQRIASISLNDGQTRFTIWHMALQGVAERPIIGWGQEGFNYVFNKYYDPSLYGQESWFDRAHNAFIDWLSAGGIPAFILYLSLFGTALFYLWRRSELSRPERIALTGALVGYAINNVFVFDNLYSYVYFFAILALVDSQVARPTRLEQAEVVSASDGIIYVLPFAAVVVCALVWFVNITGIREVTGLIAALHSGQADISSNIAAFEDLLKDPVFATQEIREQLITFASAAAQSSTVADAQKQQIVSLAITEMQKQVAAYPDDARERLQLSYIYRTVGNVAGALQEVQAAQLLSPRKEDILIEAGAIEWDRGNAKEAQSYFNKAYALAPQSQSLAVYAAAGALAVGDKKAANQILMQAYGTTMVDENILAIAYYRTKDWTSLIQLWKLRTAKPDATAQTWFALASAQYAAGDPASSIATIRAAIAKYPEAAASGAAAIQQIQTGTVK